MRALVVFILGLLLGAVAAGGVLYVNPLSNPSAPAAADGDWLLYESPVTANLVLTHSGDLPLRMNPAAIPELWESTIEGSTLLVVELRNPDGSLFGVGTRISTLSEQTELLLTGVAMDSFWTITAPGRGSLFVVEEENIWPALKEVVLPTVFFTQGWRGTRGYALTTGPLPSGHGLVLGATGAFRAQRGQSQGRYELRRYSGSDGPLDMTAELSIELPPVAPEPEAER